MFIEDIVELVNKFAHIGIADFKVEFRDGYLRIYTKDNVIIKSRTGNRVGPDMLLGEKYDAKKEDIRKIVQEEIEKYMEEHIKDVRIILK